MTKRDYMTIARLYHDYKQLLVASAERDALYNAEVGICRNCLSTQLNVFDSMVNLTIMALARDNHRFNRERFMQAVYS